MVHLAVKTIGEAVGFFLTRYWVRARIGPYVVTTTEVRRSAFQTSVTWGEGGLEVDQFGSALAFDQVAADVNHEAICERAEASTGLRRVALRVPPAA